MRAAALGKQLDDNEQVKQYTYCICMGTFCMYQLHTPPSLEKNGEVKTIDCIYMQIGTWVACTHIPSVAYMGCYSTGRGPSLGRQFAAVYGIWLGGRSTCDRCKCILVRPGGPIRWRSLIRIVAVDESIVAVRCGSASTEELGSLTSRWVPQNSRRHVVLKYDCRSSQFDTLKGSTRRSKRYRRWTVVVSSK